MEPARSTYTGTPQEEAQVIQLGNLRLDVGDFSCRIGESAVSLTYQEFELLWLLARAGGRVVSVAELSEALWLSNGVRETRRLAVLICRLRAKLARASPYVITTVYRRGYGLLDNPSPSASGAAKRRLTVTK